MSCGRRIVWIAASLAEAMEGRARLAFEMYKRASELDEDPRTMEEAQKLYRQAIETDPLLAIAYTNLGNALGP